VFATFGEVPDYCRFTSWRLLWAVAGLINLSSIGGKRASGKHYPRRYGTRPRKCWFAPLKKSGLDTHHLDSRKVYVPGGPSTRRVSKLPGHYMSGYRREAELNTLHHAVRDDLL